MPKTPTQPTQTPAQQYQAAFGFAVQQQQKFLQTPEGKVWFKKFAAECNASHARAERRREILLGIRKYEEPYFGN